MRNGRPNRLASRPSRCALDPIWEHLFPDEQARIVQLLVEQVDVQPDRAEVRIRAGGLPSLVAELREEQGVVAA